MSPAIACIMPIDLALAGVSPWAAAALAVVLVSAAVVDLRYKKVPNWLTYPAIAAGLLGHGLCGWLAGSDGQLGLLGSLAGLAVGFFPLALCWLAGGIGGGDAKLAGAIGALGGWRLALSALVYGIIVAAIMAVVVMVRRRLLRRTLRRVWHTLVLLVSRAARPADPTSADSPTIPFAVALCVGAAGAMLEPLVRRGVEILLAGG